MEANIYREIQELLSQGQGITLKTTGKSRKGQIHSDFSQSLVPLDMDNLQPQFAFLGADGQFLYKYAMASNNVAILPKPMVDLYQTDEKIKVIPFSPTFSWELCLVFPKNTFLSSASKALITFIQEYLLIKYY